MNNSKIFFGDNKFKLLPVQVKDAIIKLDNKLSNEGYIYNGVWRNDQESGGYVCVFELSSSKKRRKNLITLRPNNTYLEVEVYWGKSKFVPIDKKEKVYFEIYEDGEISNELLREIKELYNCFFK